MPALEQGLLHLSSHETHPSPMQWAIAQSQGDKAVMQDVAKVVTRSISVARSHLTLMTAAVADGHGALGGEVATNVVNAFSAIAWTRFDEAKTAVQSSTDRLSRIYQENRNRKQGIASAATNAITFIRFDPLIDTTEAYIGVLGNCAVMHVQPKGFYVSYTHDNYRAQVGEHTEGAWMFWKILLKSGDSLLLMSDGMGQVSDRAIYHALSESAPLETKAANIISQAMQGPHTSQDEMGKGCYDNAIVTLIQIP